MAAKEAYRGNGKHDWEFVVECYDEDDNEENGHVMRLRVPGGWLYNVTNAHAQANTVFVPMPEVVKHKV